jgi:MOSC domain-containing protein YiiM
MPISTGSLSSRRNKSQDLALAYVVSIAYTPEDVERRPADRFARVAVQGATLIAEQGIEGDVKGRGGGRQVNVLRAEDVAWLRAQGFHTAPGELGEQIVIAGLGSEALAVGRRFHLGESAVIEATELRSGCARFSHIQGRPKEAANGRIGFLARVLQGGDVAVGDRVSVECPDPERNL